MTPVDSSQLIQAASPLRTHRLGMPTDHDSFFARHRHDYDATHRDVSNLFVHLVAVPTFIVGSGAAALAIPLALVEPLVALGIFVVGALVASLSMGAQGRFHRREVAQPAPFAGPWDVAKRLLTEQWITFPRYVLDGGFTRALRDARADVRPRPIGARSDVGPERRRHG